MNDARVYELVKGVALGIAEIERLRRADGWSAEEAHDRAVHLVASERRRQATDEGYSPEHDDELTGGELADAAACYLLNPENRCLITLDGVPDVPLDWPWKAKAWKPST